MTDTQFTTFEAIIAEQERLEAEARSTDCGVHGCDGTFHEAGAEPRAWHHQFESTNDGLLQVDLVIDDKGRAHADVLAGFDDQTFIDLDGDALRALAKRLEAEPARLRELADRLDRRSLPEQRVAAVARKVRGELGGNRIGGDMRLNSRPLAEILDVSKKRAQDLYAGRKPFTVDELRLLSAYFDCDLQDWLSERGPDVKWPFDVTAAEDRLMTARESGHFSE